MVRSVEPRRTFVSYRVLGLFWGASLRKIPYVCLVFYARFSSADTIHAGCLGSSHAGLNPDGVHGVLDMGQGTEVRPHTRSSPAHLLISDWRTVSTVQTGGTSVTSSSRVKKAKSRFQRTTAYTASPPTTMSLTNPNQYKNGTTTWLVTRPRAILSTSKPKSEGSLSGFPLVQSSISLRPGRVCRIRSSGSFGSGLRFPKSS